MEQREGRADPEGYRFRELPIEFRFFLRNGTYEEKFFLP
jgi:hypothetical protein